MRALRFERYGPPSVLQLQDMGVPELTAGLVLIRVEASAINPSDVKNVAGAFHATLPRVPGRDYAGTVVAGDDRWAGKQVWGSGSGFGVVHDGAHAQFVVAPIEGLSAKPSRLSMEQAATVGVPYLAAWSSLVDAAGIQRGETILVNGVGGAVGHAATQVAHWKGAKVIGADVHDRPADADLFINTTGKDLATEVKSLTRGTGVDLVLDCVGGPTFESSLNSLRLRGRQVAIASIKRRVEFDLVDFYHGERRLIGVDTVKLTAAQIAAIMDRLVEGFDTGHLKPASITTWPLAKAIEAYTAVEKGSATKHVLLPQQS